MKLTTSIPQEKIKDTPAPATTKARVAKRGVEAAPTKAKLPGKAIQARKAAPAREGSKAAKVIDLLRRPGGVTLKSLMKATGWQAHSVRGFLSGALRRKLRTPVESFQSEAGERSYRLSSK